MLDFVTGVSGIKVMVTASTPVGEGVYTAPVLALHIESILDRFPYDMDHSKENLPPC